MGTLTAALGASILSLIRRMLPPRYGGDRRSGTTHIPLGEDTSPLLQKDYPELRDRDFGALQALHGDLHALDRSYLARRGYYLREMRDLMMRSEYAGSGMWDRYLARWEAQRSNVYRQIGMAGDWPHTPGLTLPHAPQQADLSRAQAYRPGQGRLAKPRTGPKNGAMAEQSLRSGTPYKDGKQNGQAASIGSWWNGERWVSLDGQEPWGDKQ